MKIMTTFASGLLALGLSAGIALAQAPTPGTTVPGASAPVPGKPAVQAPAKSVGVQKQATTPEGIECSAQADAQKLTGKPRVKFRNKCKADMRKAAKAAAGGAPKAPVTTAPAGGIVPPAKKN